MGVKKIRPTQKEKDQQPLHFHIVSLFPEAFKSYIKSSIIARAVVEDSITIDFYNPRNEVKPKGAQKLKEKPLRVVDDRPYGGGPGMVMKAEPVIKSLVKVFKKIDSRKREEKKDTLTVFLSPGGEQFTTEMAHAFTKKYTDIIFICGRYEGIDARVKEAYPMTDISVGPWVTTGGELPTLIMIDSIARQIPGVLGNFDSREESRISSHDTYTRPESFTHNGKEYRVPDVLVSGNHKEIDSWKEGKR
ncbi:MAG: tRNA (guanosine(37)-N1)-methyltransferase TrmD [Patescibacteria group bacterium]